MGEDGNSVIFEAGSATSLLFEQQDWLRRSLGVEWDPFDGGSFTDAALSGPDYGKCAECKATFANRGQRAFRHFDLCVRGVSGCAE